MEKEKVDRMMEGYGRSNRQRHAANADAASLKETRKQPIFWVGMEDEDSGIEGTYFYDEDSLQHEAWKKTRKRLLGGRGRKLDASESSFTAKRSRGGF